MHDFEPASALIVGAGSGLSASLARAFAGQGQAKVLRSPITALAHLAISLIRRVGLAVPEARENFCG